MAHIGHLLARDIPDVGNFPRGNVLPRGDKNDRLPRLRVAAQVVEVRQLLELLLQAVGHLALDFHCARAGVQRLHDHDAERELGIFLLPEVEKSECSAEHQQHHQKSRERLMPQSPIGNVVAHRQAAYSLERIRAWTGASSPSARTFCPSRRLRAPATTIFVPASSPRTSMRSPSSGRPRLTGIDFTVELASSKTQTRGPVFGALCGSKTAASGSAIWKAPLACIATLAVMPKATQAGASGRLTR